MIRQLLLFLLILSFAIGCSKEETIENSKLNIGIPSDPSSLDPILVSDLVGKKLNYLIFKPLVSKSVDRSLVEETYSESGKIFFRIKNILNSKSELLSFDDIIFCLQRIQSEKNPRKSFYSVIKKIVPIDSSNFYITYSNSKANLLDLLSHSSASIYSKTHFLKNGSFVSFGEFSLVEWKRNERIVLRSIDPNHKIKELNLIHNPNSFTGIYRFSISELDALKLPYYLLYHPIAKKNKIEKLKGRSIQYIAVNWKDTCFDQNFRLALNHSVDRKKILTKVFDDYAEETNLSFTNQYTFSENKNSGNHFLYDISLAKKFLENSKCASEIKTRELDFRLRADEENKIKGEVLLHYFKQLGLNTKLNFLEKAKLYKENGEGKGDLTLLTWYLDFDSSLNYIDPLLSSDSLGNAGNRSFYNNPEFQKIIDLSREKGELDASSQSKAIDILKQDLPWVFLWSIDETYLVSPKLESIPNWNQFLF
ncbi:MAG: ABC transporter substrate-binding protein [Leptospiraceae bacterium]|nr:ABC transporter substrate-binding protein [Leptospiraceae bacterium]